MKRLDIILYNTGLSLFIGVKKWRWRLEGMKCLHFKLETLNLKPETLGARMKAKIIITPKKAVLDPQGKTVQNALAHMGYTGVTGVHIGKYIEIDLAPGTDKAAAEKALNEAAHKLLSNPVIEDYKLEIE